MPFTSTDLANIEDAIASGVKKAIIDGKEVWYQDTGAMLIVRATIRADLASQQSIPRSYPRNQAADFSEDGTGGSLPGQRFAR
jgi:hypothetical protein